ncbi:MAG TPA: hypothetical protein VF601_14895 [Beijerinckiaceae bacterium]
MKHADGFYGVDQIVSDKIGFTGHIAEGEHSFLQGRNVEARKVLFIGVGPLGNFRYEQIRSFARSALEIAGRGRGTIARICTPVHGPGYGLDEREAFLSLIGGFLDAIEEGVQPHELERIEIVELSEKRAARLAKILNSFIPSGQRAPQRTMRREAQDASARAMMDLQFRGGAHEELATFGAASEQKPKVFVAMPFKADFSDEWEIAIQEAAETAGIICERIDKQAYVGDILIQIKNRISEYDGVLALLNENNPNVFLEIGYAWAKDKPTVLMIRQGSALPFDIQGQKCLIYSSIADLRKQLRDELVGLKKLGTFSGSKRRSS